MKRDMDLIRELLLEIEDGQKVFEILSQSTAVAIGVTPENPLSQADADQLGGHLDLLEQAGLIEIEFRSIGGAVDVKRLTWEGHDFLDAIRDPIVWRKTKDGATAAGGWTFELLKDLAKGLVKKQIEDRTGIKL